MWGGDPVKIYNAPVDIVLDQYNFNDFIAQYQVTEMVINQEEN